MCHVKCAKNEIKQHLPRQVQSLQYYDRLHVTQLFIELFKEVSGGCCMANSIWHLHCVLRVHKHYKHNVVMHNNREELLSKKVNNCHKPLQN